MAPLLRRVANLETRVPVKINGGPEIELMVDPDQIEQMKWQIVEAHGGSIELANRADRQGCVARIMLQRNGFTPVPAGV
jgi:hypothetical protein